MDTSIPQKQCTKCDHVLPATLEYFNPHKLGRYGLRPDCKECQKAYYQTRIEERKAYRDAHAEEASIYYQTHKEEIKARLKIYNNTYWHDHPEQNRTNGRNRRARILGNGGTHTAQDIQAQYDRQKGKCYYCSTKFSKGKNAYHVDHIIPISRGGSNGPENLVVTCPKCNLSKRDKLPHEWHEGGKLL